jgi:hypothetical protein
MRFSEFLDLLMLKLYEADVQRPGDSVDLYRLASLFREDVPTVWVMDAANVMGQRLLARPILGLGRLANARISGEGRLYVEQGTPIIEQAKKYPEKYFKTLDEAENSPLGVSVGNVLDSIEKKLKDDTSLRGDRSLEAQWAVNMIRARLKAGNTEDPNLIRALVEVLSRIPSVSSEAEFLAGSLERVAS